MTSLIDRLQNHEFESNVTLFQLVFYSVEREICHAVIRRFPPIMDGPQLLNLGCAPHIYPGWVNADDYSIKRRLRERSFRPNWSLDITRPWKCSNEHWDGIFTEHVIEHVSMRACEHVSYSEAVKVFKECLRTLKPGAWRRVSVPDVAKYAQHDGVEQLSPDAPEFAARALAISFATQMHLNRSAWDVTLMTRVLKETGFSEITAVSIWGGHRSTPDQG